MQISALRPNAGHYPILYFGLYSSLHDLGFKGGFRLFASFFQLVVA
jgi:hypothetical protein